MSQNFKTYPNHILGLRKNDLFIHLIDQNVNISMYSPLIFYIHTLLSLSNEYCNCVSVPWVCLQFVIVVFPDHTHYFLVSDRNF